MAPDADIDGKVQALLNEKLEDAKFRQVVVERIDRLLELSKLYVENPSLTNLRQSVESIATDLNELKKAYIGRNDQFEKTIKDLNNIYDTLR